MRALSKDGLCASLLHSDGSEQWRWVGCREQRAVDQQRQALAQRSAALPTGDADGASEVAAAAAAAKAAAAAGASAGHRPGPSKGKKNTWCEDCKVKSANYGLPSGQGKRKRWCAGCAQKGASPSARLRRTNCVRLIRLRARRRPQRRVLQGPAAHHAEPGEGGRAQRRSGRGCRWRRRGTHATRRGRAAAPAGRRLAELRAAAGGAASLR